MITRRERWLCSLYESGVWIDRVVTHIDDETEIKKIRSEIAELYEVKPLYPGLYSTDVSCRLGTSPRGDYTGSLSSAAFCNVKL